VWILGFGAKGVALGSIAAWIQSVLYGGSVGWIFSLLQSIGATAVGWTSFLSVWGGLGLFGYRAIKK